MLILSMWLLGTAFMAMLLAAEWYIWEPRYRKISGSQEPRPGHRILPGGKDLVHAQSASGREVVATFTAPSLPADVRASGTVQGEWMDHHTAV